MNDVRASFESGFLRRLWDFVDPNGLVLFDRKRCYLLGVLNEDRIAVAERDGDCVRFGAERSARRRDA